MKVSIQRFFSFLVLLLSFNVVANDYDRESQITAAALVRVLGDETVREYGTGVIVNSSQNNEVAITANHVVKDSDDAVVFIDNKKISAKVLARDSAKDLAIIQYSKQTTSTGSFQSSYVLRVGRLNLNDCDLGENLVVSGYPLGKKTLRYVDSSILNLTYLGKNFGAEVEGGFISEGMSGGIVLNSNGEWVGLATDVRSQQEGEIALMVKYGAIVKFLGDNDIPINQLLQNNRVGQWSLTGVSRNKNSLNNVQEQYRLTLNEDGNATGLVNNKYCIKEKNKITFEGSPIMDIGTPRIMVPTNVSGSQTTPYRLTDANSCSSSVASAFDWSSNGNGSSWIMSMQCDSKIFSGTTNLGFKRIIN